MMHDPFVCHRSYSILVNQVVSQQVEQNCQAQVKEGEEAILVNTFLTSFWLILIGENRILFFVFILWWRLGNSKDWVLRKTSSSKSIYSFALTCKNYKYKLGESIGGNAPNTVSDIKGADLIWVNKENDSVKIVLFTIFVGFTWGKTSREMKEMNLSHHLI